MKRKLSLRVCLVMWALVCFGARLADAADRVIIGNVSRTVEQLPNYAANDKGFFTQEGIQGDVVLIGSTDTLIQALIAGQVNVAIVDPSPAINAVERGASLKIIGGTVPIAAYTLVGCPKYKTIKELKGTTIGVVSLVSGSTIFLREMLKKEGLGAQSGLFHYSRWAYDAASGQSQRLQHVGDHGPRRRPAASAGARFYRDRSSARLYSQPAIS